MVICQLLISVNKLKSLAVVLGIRFLGQPTLLWRPDPFGLITDVLRTLQRPRCNVGGSERWELQRMSEGWPGVTCFTQRHVKEHAFKLQGFLAALEVKEKRV